MNNIPFLFFFSAQVPKRINTKNNYSKNYFQFKLHRKKAKKLSSFISLSYNCLSSHTFILLHHFSALLSSHSLIYISHFQSPPLAVATPTPPSTTATTWPPPPLPNHSNMLGLHNIFLIAQPSSFYPHQPISSTNPLTHDHSNIIQNIGQEPSWVAFRSYQQQQDSSFDARKEVGSGDDEENIASGSTRACRDCGNRAKKECEFMRCRTCCKSRGYDCVTHVKSTWVSVARKREKHGASSGSSAAVSCGGKRPRDNIATSNSSSNNNHAASLTFDTGSSYQDASFKESLPGQVRAPAVFRCIRVSAVSNGGESEIVYQAMVNISGHVFKGLLYDQGIDENNAYPCISKVQSSGDNRASTSSTFAAPPGAYTDIA